LSSVDLSRLTLWTWSSAAVSDVIADEIVEVDMDRIGTVLATPILTIKEKWEKLALDSIQKTSLILVIPNKPEHNY